MPWARAKDSKMLKRLREKVSGKSSAEKLLANVTQNVDPATVWRMGDQIGEGGVGTVYKVRTCHHSRARTPLLAVGGRAVSLAHGTGGGSERRKRVCQCVGGTVFCCTLYQLLSGRTQGFSDSRQPTSTAHARPLPTGAQQARCQC